MLMCVYAYVFILSVYPLVFTYFAKSYKRWRKYGPRIHSTVQNVIGLLLFYLIALTNTINYLLL